MFSSKYNRFNLNKLKFTVVDDNAYSLEIVSEVLRSFGSGATGQARTVEDGLEEIEAVCPDIVLIDWVLGVQSGLDLVKKIRSHKDKHVATTSIIMVSAFSDKLRILRAMQAGVNDYIVKPIEPRTLYFKIHDIIKNPRNFAKKGGYYFLMPRQVKNSSKEKNDVTEKTLRHSASAPGLTASSGR